MDRGRVQHLRRAKLEDLPRLRVRQGLKPLPFPLFVLLAHPWYRYRQNHGDNDDHDDRLD
jgi:hypothetical protein